MKKIYLIGSLRNSKVAELANELRPLGFDVFDDWISVGPKCDDEWQSYEKSRGRTFAEALAGHHARDVFEFDKRHLDSADIIVLVLPAGKSAHLELGYVAGLGKTTFILMGGEPERFDIMYLFADKVVMNKKELINELEKQK